MTNEQIKEIALKNGFKLKEQPSGEMDLNPYVYDFARAILLDELHKVQDEVFDLTDSSYKMGSNPKLEHCDLIIENHIAKLREVENE